MSFWDTFGDSGSSFWDSFGGDSGGGSVFDYTGGDYGDSSTIGDLFGDDGSGGSSSSGGSWWQTLLGGSGSSGSSGSSIFGGLLSGLGAGAAAALSGKDLKESIQTKAKEDRKSLDFEASLKDYYAQTDKQRKRIALDTYGQFSTINKIKPGYVDTPMPLVPTKPVAS